MVIVYYGECCCHCAESILGGGGLYRDVVLQFVCVRVHMCVCALALALVCVCVGGSVDRYSVPPCTVAKVVWSLLLTTLHHW